MKLCKNCKHMERGFLAWFKDRTQKKCTRQDVEYTDKVSGITVKRTILLNCNSQRWHSIDELCGPPGSTKKSKPFENTCGKEAQFFEPRFTNRVEPSKPWPRK